jgi:sensor histidine kinase YesM
MFVIVLFCALLLKTNQRWRKLQQEKLETELSYLKAQINPHFLFNTLNSIYSLAIEKSDYTATAVVKLSGMMRYIISESHKNFVSLEKEVNYINDYIELQKFRLGGTVEIQYSLQGNYNRKEIAPLILITFVENAFKYGVNPEQHSKILVRIDIENDSLILAIENNKVTTSQEKIEASGLGISNTRNRLEMLYPGKYKLNINDGVEKFKVHLEVTLQ